MNEEKKNKGNKLEFSQRDLTVDVAIYVMALGAILADNKIEDDELDTVLYISELFNHGQHYDDALAYFEHFKDNESAIDGAIEVIKKADDTAKIATVAFMSYVLAQDGVNKDEVKFYEKVVAKIQ